MSKYGKSEFIKAAKVIHGAKYIYSKVVYVNAHTKVIIKCRIHGEFQQVPNSHLVGRGCPTCGQLSRNATRASNTSEFIKSAKNVHGTRFSYSDTEYISSRLKVSIICKIHGVFKQTPNDHLSGKGCPKCKGDACSKRRRGNLENFLSKSFEVHGNKFTYENVDYVSASKHVAVTCKIHGDFDVTPNNHLRGTACPMCCQRTYSKIAIEWIEQEAFSRRMKNVQHAENGGEYKIPNTRLKVDGYHAATKTVFEFHGDAYHGNPKVFKPNSYPHPFSTLTARQLFNKTKEREAALKALGYNVITMWESDFREQIRKKSLKC